MHTKESILQDLKALKVPQDQTVIVHTSLRAVGAIEGGGEVLLDALIRHITAQGGRLLIPTHTWANLGKKDVILDLSDPNTCIGTLPNLAAAHPEAIRSLHPTHSMAVFGKEKTRYAALDDQSTTPTSPEGCYGTIGNENGYVLLLGIGQEKNTYLHAVEEEILGTARYHTVPTPMKIRKKNGEVVIRPMLEFDESVVGDVSLRFPKFEPLFRQAECIRDGVIGSAPAQLCSAAKMKEVMILLYRCFGTRDPLGDDLPFPELNRLQSERS